MRLAIFSDVHGNPIALDAVLADIRARGGADEYLILGDLAVAGYDPAGTLQRLSEIPNARFVRGNTEAWLTAGEPAPTLAALRGKPEEIAQYVTLGVILAWSHGHLAATGWLPWVAQLPLEERLTLPNGMRLLAVHAAPGKDGSEPGPPRPALHPAQTEDEARAQIAGCDADIVCVGHTHAVLDRVVMDISAGPDGFENARPVRILNCGSVSNPLAPDLRASYILLEADTSPGVRVEFHRVAYDIPAVLEALRASGHPTAESLAENFHGKRVPPWLRS
jgi:predicted phosphodiesterase